MKHAGFVKVVLLVMFVLFFAATIVSAQELLPPDDPVLAEPKIVETTRFERVETADGQILLIPAFTMELTQEVRSSSPNSPNSTVTHPSGWTMTMWRALWWQQSFWGNYEVKAGGRTSTSVTADILYLGIDHHYRSPGGSWRGVMSNVRDLAGVSTTGEVWTGAALIASGLEHRAVGDHQAFVGNDSLIYNDQTGPQRIIP